MKIRLISDVHHEFYEDERLYANKGEDVLVVAGDLAVGSLDCWRALKRFADNTENVVYVPGNHEYYHNSIEEFDARIQQYSANTNIHFLNPGTVKLGKVTFVGAALWTNFRDDPLAELHCKKNISDFRVIKQFGTEKCVNLYRQHVGYIKHVLSEAKGPRVVVTHFLPDVSCIDPQYSAEGVLNKYFANELGEWISDLENTTWLFGHTHSNVNVVVGTTPLIANPYGYYRNDKYQEQLIVV